MFSSLFLFPFKCLGTYTIVSYDTDTGNVGGTGTTCITEDGIQVSIVYASVPSKGVVAAQSAVNITARDIAIQKIKSGENSSVIIEEFQNNKAIDIEQYGIVTSHENKGYTGSSCSKWAGDIQGQVNGFEFSFQGNILTSNKVGSQASAAFIETKPNAFTNDAFSFDDKINKRGCEMAWRLFHAVQAGEENGQGDSRCEGRAGTTSFLRVDLNNGEDTGVFYKDGPGATACLSQTLENNVPNFMKGMLSFYKSPIHCDFTQRGYPKAFLSIEIAADGDSDPLEKLDNQFRSWAKINNCDEE